MVGHDPPDDTWLGREEARGARIGGFSGGDTTTPPSGVAAGPLATPPVAPADTVVVVVGAPVVDDPAMSPGAVAIGLSTVVVVVPAAPELGWGWANRATKAPLATTAPPASHPVSRLTRARPRRRAR